MRSQAKGRIALVVGALALAACTARVTGDPSSAGAPAGTTQASRPMHAPVGVVIDTVRAVGKLDAEQARRLDTIESELAAERSDHRALREKLRASLASVVRSGTADSKQFDRSVNDAVAAFEQRVDQSVAALEEIHGILTPAQRAAVAASLRARLDAGHAKRERPRFQRVASYLLLSSLQIDKLRAIKKELLGEKQQVRPSQGELRALVDAFEGDDFSAALDALRAQKLALLHERVAHAGQRTDSVLAVLTPEQRDLLADLIVKGPRQVLLGQPATPVGR